MAKTSINATKASTHGGVLGFHGGIDTLCLTDNAVSELVQVTTPPALTQNTTNTTYLGCTGRRCFLLAAYAAAHVAPIQSGGTMSYNVYVSVAGAAGTLIATIDPQTLVADIGSPFTLQSANDAMVINPQDTIYVTAVASNNAIGTAATGPTISLILRPLESSVAGVATITGDKNGL